MGYPIKPRVPRIKWSDSLTKGIIFNTPFYERGGTSAKDIVNKKNCSFGGISNPTWTSHVPGSGLKFNGTPGATTTTSYVVASTSKILASLVNSSLFIIIRTSTNYSGMTNGITLWSERASSGNDIWKLEIPGETSPAVANSIDFVHRDDAGTLDFIRSATVAKINDGKIHFIGFSKRGTSLILYVDGFQYFTGTLTGNDTMTNAIQTYLGGDLGDNTSNYDGNMFQVVAWNRTLLPQEFKQLYSNSWRIYNQESD